ncbi:MAG: SCO family protein [Gammaproteobacteria bacterium]|nr:SCO family protein [Gammaproteobacteria bacterium]
MKTIALLLASALILWGVIYNVFQPKPPAFSSVIIYPNAKPLPEFELTDHNNNSFKKLQLQGKWSLMFFGYTSCPDICPTTMTALTQVANTLPPEILKQLQFVFVSIDPERDSIEQLADYVPFFHQDFIGITGDLKQLTKLAMNLGAMFIKVPVEDLADKESVNNYSMSHSGSLFVIDPRGRRHGIFTMTTGAIDTTSITQDLDIIIRYK